MAVHHQASSRTLQWLTCPQRSPNRERLFSWKFTRRKLKLKWWRCPLSRQTTTLANEIDKLKKKRQDTYWICFYFLWIKQAIGRSVRHVGILVKFIIRFYYQEWIGSWYAMNKCIIYFILYGFCLFACSLTIPKKVINGRSDHAETWTVYDTHRSKNWMDRKHM